MTKYAPLRIECIVEGQGDKDALPEVVRRILREVAPHTNVSIGDPVRVSRSKLVRRNDLEGYVELLARRLRGGGAILVVIDADDDCPADLGPKLLGHAQGVRPNIPMSVVLANREFEAWYLAAIESLHGICGLKKVHPPPDAEAIRDAKGWLSRNMHEYGYSPTIDQVQLARKFDLTAARRAPSFDKLYRDMQRIAGELLSR